MKRFAQYMLEQKTPKNTCVFTFGRFQPCTIGHEKIFTMLEKYARKEKGGFLIFTSQTHDRRDNPLEYREKIGFMRTMFPRYGRNIIENGDLHTIADVLDYINGRGFNSIIMITGSDHVKKFDGWIKQYNGVDRKDGRYYFMSIDVISAGVRDPDSDRVEGISATRARQYVSDDRFEDFEEIIPGVLKDKKRLFDTLGKRMNV